MLAGAVVFTMRPVNEWFQPEKLARLYRIYAAIAAIPSLVFVAFIAVVANPFTGYVLGGIWLVVFAFVAWWTGAFAETATYRLTDNDVEYRRGVWWKKQSDIPYDRITNVDTNEGPVQRLVGVGSVDLHTAGYAAQTGAELTINGVTDYEPIKEQILAKVRERQPVATEGAPTQTHLTEREEPSSAVLDELRRIRHLLEAHRDT